VKPETQALKGLSGRRGRRAIKVTQVLWDPLDQRVTLALRDRRESRAPLGDQAQLVLPGQKVTQANLALKVILEVLVLKGRRALLEHLERSLESLQARLPLLA